MRPNGGIWKAKAFCVECLDSWKQRDVATCMLLPPACCCRALFRVAPYQDQHHDHQINHHYHDNHPHFIRKMLPSACFVATPVMLPSLRQGYATSTFLAWQNGQLDFYFSTFILPCKQCIWYNTFPLFCGTLHLHTWHYTQTFKLAASLLPFFRANICSYTWLNDSNTEMWICSFYLLFLICRILSPIIIYSSSI